MRWTCVAKTRMELISRKRFPALRDDAPCIISHHQQLLGSPHTRMTEKAGQDLAKVLLIPGQWS